jgi:hypothetical protein
MESIIRNVRHIDADDREALEHAVGRPLREDQQVIINIVSPDLPIPTSESAKQPAAALPDWCNVYADLTEDEIDEIEKSIIRSSGGRSFD